VREHEDCRVREASFRGYIVISDIMIRRAMDGLVSFLHVLPLAKSSCSLLELRTESRRQRESFPQTVSSRFISRVCSRSGPGDSRLRFIRGGLSTRTRNRLRRSTSIHRTRNDVHRRRQKPTVMDDRMIRTLDYAIAI